MQDIYYTLKLTPNKHYQLFLDFILETTDTAIEELEGSLILRSSDPMEDITQNITLFSESLREALDEDITVVIETANEKNEDWIEKYKKSISPIAVASFFIKPSWSVEKSDAPYQLTIDPSLSFGSGHHESTRGCLTFIEKYVKKDALLLDVGCGSGILAMAGAKLGAICDMCDTDEVAVEEAKKNFSLNGLHYQNAWVGSAIGAEKKYDIVVANIIADVLVLIKKDLIQSLKTGGILIMSGIIDARLQNVLKKYTDLQLLETLNDKEWNTVVFKKGD